MNFKTICLTTALLITASSAVAEHKYKRTASSQYIGNICLGFKATVNNSWHSALKSAINKYNSAFKSSTNLGFCYNPSYDSSPWNATFVVLINVANFGNTGWDGKADYPARNGQPGANMQINTYNTLGPDEKTSIIMHEMGHIIGLMHTDGFFGSRVPGSTGTDPNSIFRDPTGENILPVFTSKDIAAVRSLYG